MKKPKFVVVQYDNSPYGSYGKYETVIIRLNAIKAINVSQGVIHMGDCNYNHVREEDIKHIVNLIADEID